MSDITVANSDGSRRPMRARRAVPSVTSQLIAVEIPTAASAPVEMRAAIPEVDVVSWARDHRSLIDEYLVRYGAIRFRGFGIVAAGALQEFAVASSSGDLSEYQYASTPRRRISGDVYTSTEYPADLTIPFHNELSYFSRWPMKIWFCCEKPADAGGSTPIASSTAVFARIEPAVRERFIERGVLYVRNYGSYLDLPYAEVFGTSDRSQIVAFCRETGIECRWHADGTLTTSQKRPAVIVHPKTRQPLWFNQAHLFHVSSLGQHAASSLVAQFGEERLPRQAYYGDGSAIEPEALAHIRAAYDSAAISFDWEQGDVLMLDNMLVAHGRKPYTGTRRILVVMGEPFVAPSV